MITSSLGKEVMSPTPSTFTTFLCRRCYTPRRIRISSPSASSRHLRYNSTAPHSRLPSATFRSTQPFYPSINRNPRNISTTSKMSFSNTDVPGDKPADPYKAKNKNEPDLKEKVEDLSNFISQCKFGMMTTRIESSGLLTSRCMALAAKVGPSSENYAPISVCPLEGPVHPINI